MVPRETLDKVLNTEYPKTLALSGGQTVAIRPLRSEDEHALLAFFHRVPADERGRFFRDNVVDPVLVAKWCRKVDPQKVLCLLAWDGERVVGDGTLHRERHFMKSHVGQMRISVDPEYRHRGLGHDVVRELLDLAPYLGLSWVDAEVVSFEQDAIALLTDLAFQQVGIFPDHGQDITGAKFDIVLMSRFVAPFFDPEIGGQG